MVGWLNRLIDWIDRLYMYIYIISDWHIHVFLPFPVCARTRCLRWRISTTRMRMRSAYCPDAFLLDVRLRQLVVLRRDASIIRRGARMWAPPAPPRRTWWVMRTRTGTRGRSPRPLPGHSQELQIEREMGHMLDSFSGWCWESKVIFRVLFQLS